MSARFRWWAAVSAVAAAVLASSIGAIPATADSAVTRPADDPFYNGPPGWAGAEPGTVLRSRTVQLAPTAIPLPIQATQVLYRTTSQRGEPDATVATIIRPPLASTPPRLISYQNAYDSLTPDCDPSYMLRGGGGGSLPDAVIIAGYLAAGFTVVVSDYEGTNLAYGAGRQSGTATLDGIRAALHTLDAPTGTPVGVTGFSGGSIATEFAAELAPTYAPELNIIGTAAGGMPADMAATIDYVDGSPQWALVLPYVLQGAARGFGLDLTPYLTDYGKQVMSQITDHCAATGPRYPGLRLSQLLLPQYQDYRAIPAFAAILSENRMGSAGTPKAPMIFGAGNVDGTGDGVIVASGERALATDYCTRGLPVQYIEYPGSDHLTAGALFAPAAQAFLMARFAAAPVTGSCALLTH